MADQGEKISGSIEFPDYLVRYVADGKFDLPRLLNDDFFVPIKLLFNNKHYVSSAKLLLIFIDTISFLERGTSDAATFRGWLDQYCDLAPLGVTSEELWEWRNGLLHMSNLDSRKVSASKVKRLISFVGPLPDGFPMESPDGKLLNLHGLVKAVAGGLQKQIEAMNLDRATLVRFLERYDLVISDSRLLTVTYGPEAGNEGAR